MSAKKIFTVLSFSVCGLSLCPLRSYITEVINLCTCAKILNTQDHSVGVVGVISRGNSCLVHLLYPKMPSCLFSGQQFPSCPPSPRHWTVIRFVHVLYAVLISQKEIPLSCPATTYKEVN